MFIDRAILNPAKPIAGLPEDRLLTVGATDWLERGSLTAWQSLNFHRND